MTYPKTQFQSQFACVHILRLCIVWCNKGCAFFFYLNKKSCFYLLFLHGGKEAPNRTKMHLIICVVVPLSTDRPPVSHQFVRQTCSMHKTKTIKNYNASDTHTEDVKAHSSFNPFLVGEVIPGELVDCCRVNAHKQ